MQFMKIPLGSTLMSVMFIMLLTFCSDPTEKRDYGRWDEDQSTSLDDREFGTAWTESGYFARWDANSNGYLDESEWHTARNQQLRGYEGSFQDWDADGDNRLSEEELRLGIYSYYDKDGDSMISEEEYNEWYTPNTNE